MLVAVLGWVCEPLIEEEMNVELFVLYSDLEILTAYFEIDQSHFV